MCMCSCVHACVCVFKYIGSEPIGELLSHEALLEFQCDDHTANWSDMFATAGTPDSSMNFTPCYMTGVTITPKEVVTVTPNNGLKCTPFQHTHNIGRRTADGCWCHFALSWGHQCNVL